MLNNNKIIPFALKNANEDSPYLMYEIKKHLKILFSNQVTKNPYKNLMKELGIIEVRARNACDDDGWSGYITEKEYQFEYVKCLEKYVPTLLQTEKFFVKAFK